MLNAFTVDVEDWFMTSDLNIDVQRWGEYENRLVRSTGLVLDLLSRFGVRATFFVLGFVALKHPELVARIAGAGHEIGSHGMYHRMVGLQAREEFSGDVKESKRILEDIAGRAVKAYRAPSWSISRDTLWALEVLEEEGFTIDSSIYPIKTPLYGISGSPVVPFYPVVNGRRLELVEFPATVLHAGPLRLPFAGGLYLRLIPGPLISRALKRVNRSRPGMVYVHPWEMDPGQPRLAVRPAIKLTHYCNLHTTAGKLESLLSDFSFTTLGELTNTGLYPVLPVVKN